jgi:hypothetical protein
MDVPVVLAIAGVVALLIGFLGGGIRAKEIEIPSIPTLARVVVSVGGLFLIGVAIWLSSPDAFTSPPPPTDLPTEPPADVTLAPSPVATLPTVTETSTPGTAGETFTVTPDPATSDTFVEDFTRGSQYWETGLKDSDGRTASRSVVNGVFRWQVTAKQDVVTGIGSKLPIMSDFDLEVTLKKVEGSETVQYGVAFRETETGSYSFFLGSNGYYVLAKWSEADSWVNLIDWTASTAINLNGENKLRVYAVGDKLRLYINDTLVADFVDSSFAAGNIDIEAWLDAEENLTLDMTSFKITLLSP